MKKAFIFIFLILILSLTAAANHIDDKEGLLARDEKRELETLLEDVSLESDLYVKIVTTPTFDGMEIEEYAEKSAPEENAVILLVSLAKREVNVSSFDDASKLYTNKVCRTIRKEITSDLTNGDFYTAFVTYADLVVQYKDGKPISISSIFIPVVIGFVIGLISVSVMKSKLKTVRPQKNADCYVKSGSLNITESHDRFLWRTVNRTQKNTDSSSGGRSSSGSSGSF